MRKEEITQALTALLASAFLHHERMLSHPTTANPPTPTESREAYLNNPTIHALTVASVYGIYEILSHNPAVEPGICSCRVSDPWRCAVDQGLSTVICGCQCHKRRSL